MNKQSTITNREVEYWLELVQDGPQEIKVQAVSTLTRMLFWGEPVVTRGPSVRSAVRGTQMVEVSATVREKVVAVLINELKQTNDSNLKREIAYALGHWAAGTMGRQAVIVLIDMIVNHSSEPSFRRTVVNTLGMLGGEQAMLTLKMIATNPEEDEDVRYDAAMVIGSVLSEAKEQKAVATTQVPEYDVVMRGPVRTRGAVRTRGSAVFHGGNVGTSQTQSLIATLHQIADNPDEPKILQVIAQDQLKMLGVA